MRRLLLLLTIVNLTTLAAAAQDRPQVTAELDPTEAVIGQPLVLRIKVLVPTWLPQPPEFPSLDLPGLLVRLPERASGPVTERVGSDNWSGVQRAYRLYPLQPGTFEIPGQSVRVTYAKPGGSDPVSEEVVLKPIVFKAVVPEAASGLDPLIVASEFSLEAKIEGQDQLAVGGAVVRTLDAKISGTTPILIPKLTPDTTVNGLRAYPDEPSVIDKEDRGTLSGTRSERTTYLATTEGSAELPAVRFDWFNLETGNVETAEVANVPLSIKPGEATQGKSQPVSWWKLLAGLIVTGVVFLIVRAVWPRLNSWILSVKERWRASEPYASRQVANAIRRKELGDVYTALEAWECFYTAGTMDDVRPALARVGREIHSQAEHSSGARHWAALRESFESARRTALRTKRQFAFPRELNPLNPDWTVDGGS
jgi:hypothetical protein